MMPFRPFFRMTRIDLIELDDVAAKMAVLPGRDQ